MGRGGPREWCRRLLDGGALMLPSVRPPARSCGPMMLDVLLKIKDEQDQTLAFRRSCRCEPSAGSMWRNRSTTPHARCSGAAHSCTCCSQCLSISPPSASLDKQHAQQLSAAAHVPMHEQCTQAGLTPTLCAMNIVRAGAA